MIYKKVSRCVQNISRGHMEWVSSPLYTHVRAGLIPPPPCYVLKAMLPCLPAYLKLRFTYFSPAYVYIKKRKQAFFLLLIISRGVLTIA